MQQIVGADFVIALPLLAVAREVREVAFMVVVMAQAVGVLPLVMEVILAVVRVHLPKFTHSVLVSMDLLAAPGSNRESVEIDKL
ncbi:MAG TPA: hypothetical protein VG965_02200 [Patescibacteria group bacterium]|nr:hypothetical protein [Patescibacteria group bacterium]